MGCALQPWLCHKERPPAGNGGRLRSAFREPATVARSVSRHFNAGRARRFRAPADNRRSPFSRPVAGDIGGPDLSAARAAEQDALNRHKITATKSGSFVSAPDALSASIWAVRSWPWVLDPRPTRDNTRADHYLLICLIWWHIGNIVRRGSIVVWSFCSHKPHRGIWLPLVTPCHGIGPVLRFEISVRTHNTLTK
jgi:hypothetical protein